MLDSFPFPLSDWPGINSTEDGRPPGWTTPRRTSGRHRHVQSRLMRKIIIFLVQIVLAALAFWLLRRSLCGSKAVSAERLATSPGDHCAFQTAQHRQEIQRIKDQTEMFLVLFTLWEEMTEFMSDSVWMCRRLSYRCGKLLSLPCPRSVNRLPHLCRQRCYRITQQLLSPVFSRFLWPCELGSGRVSLATKCITVVLPKGSFNAPRVTFPCRNLPW